MVGPMNSTTILVADIGGTKSELALFPDNSYSPLFQKRYLNNEFDCVEDVVDAFYSEFDTSADFCCMDVAGVVRDGTVKLTNLSWLINARELEKRFSFRKAELINDLTAVASSLLVLAPDDLFQIQHGPEKKGEVKGVLAPGTGLGEGFLVESGGQFFVRGTEGGHTNFGPVDQEQLELLGWVQKRTGSIVSYESLIAGPGFGLLYDFYTGHMQMEPSPWVEQAMAGLKDRTPIIVSGVTGEEKCPVCLKIIDLFLSILGSEAGNLALKLYAKGGIYLGGGILPRLAGHIDFDGFLRHFHNKGVMAGFMQDIPVALILKKDAALLGTARYAVQMIDGW